MLTYKATDPPIATLNLAFFDVDEPVLIEYPLRSGLYLRSISDLIMILLIVINLYLVK